MKKEISPTKIIENRPVTPSMDTKYDFTYLEELSKDKLEKYNLFLKDGNTSHLTSFTPEQIVLIYLNLVMEYQEDKIYALTYDGGQLPPLEIFINEYREYLSFRLEEDGLKYRFYDSITVDEKTRKSEVLAIRMSIRFGKSMYIVAYGLKKEKNVWKMDLYPLVEDAKKRKK